MAIEGELLGLDASTHASAKIEWEDTFGDNSVASILGPIGYKIEPCTFDGPRFSCPAGGAPFTVDYFFWISVHAPISCYIEKPRVRVRVDGCTVQTVRLTLDPQTDCLAVDAGTGG